MSYLKLKKKLRKKIGLIIVSFVVLILVFLTSYNVYFLKKIFPGTYVVDFPVGGKTPDKATFELGNKFSPPKSITLTSQNQNFEISVKDIGFSYDFAATSQAAYGLTRTGNIFYDIYKRFSLPFKKTEIGLRFNIDEEKLQNSLAVVTGQVGLEPTYPTVNLVNGQPTVQKGSVGYEVDQDSLRAQVGRALALGGTETVTIPLKKIDPVLTDKEAEDIQIRAGNLISKSISLKYEDKTFDYKGEDLFTYLDPKGEYKEGEVSGLAKSIAGELNSLPQDSVFIFLPAQAGENGKVKEFAPSKNGITVNEGLLKEMIIGNLRTLEQSEEKVAEINIPVNLTPPKIKTEDVNNLGIKELLGRGSSLFYHSIPNRIHNINLASSKFQGVLVPPGETFSFNKTLGDVSQFTGYKQAYIIKEGKTVLGDGGGVCQVSTTLFRAALAAGLPILERVAHAYRVGYYEEDSPPGLDATVYDPSADLKIKNDTPAYILIQATVNLQKMNLTFDIYGTSDGRVASTTKPVISNQTPPPADLYQDDPTLPIGTINQIDFSAWGAKVTFNYSVERNGETIYNKTFVSNYQPWQAIYLRGTKPVQ